MTNETPNACKSNKEQNSINNLIQKSQMTKAKKKVP
jgi:hypothetical protein